MRSVPPLETRTGGGLDNDVTWVLYLAKSPTHAVAEVLREFRGRSFETRPHGPPARTRRRESAEAVMAEIADRWDPEGLLHYGIRADAPALPESERAVTQAGVRARSTTRERQASGGGRRVMHCTVVFVDRVPLNRPSFGSPVMLGVKHSAVFTAGSRAADALNANRPRSARSDDQTECRVCALTGS